MYTNQEYIVFDNFLMGGMYYMNSVARDSEGIILTDFKGNNAFDIVAYNVASNYSNAKNKKLYVKANIFKFIWLRYIKKFYVKFYCGNYMNHLLISPSEIINEVCKAEETGVNIVYDIYNAYYKERTIQ